MKIECFIVGTMGVNCYVLSADSGKECFIVDPGGCNTMVCEYIEKNKLEVKAIILTHGHGDHFGGIKKLLETYKVPIFAHKEEKILLNHDQYSHASAIFGKVIEFDADCYVTDGEEIALGNEALKFIHTPGHSPGGMCLYTEGILVSGDTLFQGSVGRTDFPLCSTEDLMGSIKEKLFILPDETTVYPGHGPETTIGYEKKFNPFF